MGDATLRLLAGWLAGWALERVGVWLGRAWVRVQTPQMCSAHSAFQQPLPLIAQYSNTTD